MATKKKTAETAETAAETVTTTEEVVAEAVEETAQEAAEPALVPVKVRVTYRDRETLEIHKAGSTTELTPARFEELSARKFVVRV